MGIFNKRKCKKHGHDYDANSVCRTCGKECVDHNWVAVPNPNASCSYRCSECNVKKVEHKWDGCICTVCHKHRGFRAEHDWNLVHKKKEEKKIGNTGTKLKFIIEERLCKKCGEKSSNNQKVYCPKCSQPGNFNWTSDGDYAEFKFTCAHCGKNIHEDYREKGSALGRT